VKWRFYEDGRLSVAIKSGLTFRLATMYSSRCRRTPGAPISFSTYVLDQWAFHLHLGISISCNELNARVNIWHASAAVERNSVMA